MGQPITPVTCTCYVTTTNRIPRMNPQLPIGLSFETTSETVNYYPLYTVVITGTPSVAQQLSTYSVGNKEYVTQFQIGIIGTPSSLSYGFDSMTQYVGVPIEPIPVRSDAYLNQFTIQPALPAGVTIDTATGTITGKFPDTSMSNQVFTVTGSNSMGSVTTTVKFFIRAEAEMTTPGFIGCYWSGTTECRTPAFDYYYFNPAQYCQIETKLDFADSYYEGEGNTWPGLDERFRDYYTSYMYGYFNVLVDGAYDFTMDSDDASFLYIDNLDEPVINRDGCRGTSPEYMTVDLTVGRHLFVVKFLEINGAAVLYLKFASVDAGIAQQYVDNTMTTVGGRGPTFITYSLITGYVNAELKVYTPEMSSGGASSWTVDPALPNGMALDSARGQIRGKPTAEYYGKHTVSATGVNGVASTEIEIAISSSPLPGFRASYYKIYDPEMCMYTNLAPSQMELKVVKTDSQINFPTDLVGAWSGLPPDLTDYFFGEWEGRRLVTGRFVWVVMILAVCSPLKTTCRSIVGLVLPTLLRRRRFLFLPLAITTIVFDISRKPMLRVWYWSGSLHREHGKLFLLLIFSILRLRCFLTIMSVLTISRICPLRRTSLNCSTQPAAATTTSSLLFLPDLPLTLILVSSRVHLLPSRS